MICKNHQYVYYRYQVEFRQENRIQIDVSIIILHQDAAVPTLAVAEIPLTPLRGYLSSANKRRNYYGALPMELCIFQRLQDE